MRWFLLGTLMSNALYAEGIPEERLASIYTEALWFVAVITLMAVISFVISSRNARKYEEEQLTHHTDIEEKDTVIEIEPDTSLAKSNIVEDVDRLIALSKLLEKGLLSETEFQVFKKQLLEAYDV